MAINRQPDPKSLTGPQKAAIFLLAMGEEFSKSFFKRLDEESIQKIGRCMADITYVHSDVLDAVLKEFLTGFGNETNTPVSGRSFLKKVVAKSLDDETARKVFKAIGDEGASTPFSDLAYISAENLVNIIEGEHPQTIALILSYLPNEKAGEILSLLPEEIKPDVALRIVQIKEVPNDIIMELDDAIKKDLSKVKGASRKFDGVEALANILNRVDGQTEEFVLSTIEKDDGDLAEMIRQKMFVFEDLLEVDDRSFREILKNIDNQLLVKALKTASEEMKQKIFGNLSERAAGMLKEDMEIMGPVRLKEVEEAQQAVVKAAKTLEGEGKIVLVGKGKEDVLV
ncbi:MAG: flagellar motor switch protein FliG [Deltaproteobacteria bacterium]|nr:flagellar motor switch protein FliG [Deltaproteobacteria bacterium]